ncbi:MAG TPA: papain-like cysteine protease family protein [Terracidiphilus sp.]|nr:papain-like cysteine protease family protein [Terracidiphilus sp.]
MQRRAFLRVALAGAGSIVLPRTLFAAKQCDTPASNGMPMGPQPVEYCTTGISSVTFKQAYQQQNEWCWAACISMVFDFYHHPVDQQRIVKETWGTIADMPGMPDDILRDLNKSWIDDAGHAFECNGDAHSVNVDTAIQDLTDDHPLIIGAYGHATVLTAIVSEVDPATSQYQIQQVIVRDPWPGSGGRRPLSPMEWRAIDFAARIRVTDVSTVVGSAHSGR